MIGFNVRIDFYMKALAVSLSYMIINCAVHVLVLSVFIASFVILKISFVLSVRLSYMCSSIETKYICV